MDGKRVATIDTFASSTRTRVAMKIFRSSSDIRRHVVIKALGTRSTRSGGTAVTIDALTARA